jgi:hypothetical protein
MLNCGCYNVFCGVWGCVCVLWCVGVCVLWCVGVCMCRFCDVWVCVYVCFVMCECVYVWVL